MRSLKIISLCLLLSSCAVLKKDKTTTTKQTEKTEIKSDSSSKETVNQKIDDSATIKVVDSNTGNADFDNRVNDAVANVLRSINFQKSSGDNSYRAYYDEKLKALQFQVELGETRNSETTASDSSVVEKTDYERVNEFIKKIVVPWWAYLILLFLFRKQIFGILAFIFPQIRGLKTFKDVITPPDK